MNGFMPNQGLSAFAGSFFADTYIGLLEAGFIATHDSSRFDFYNHRAVFSGYDTEVDASGFATAHFDLTYSDGSINGTSNQCVFQHDGGPVSDTVGGFYSRTKVEADQSSWVGAPVFGGSLNASRLINSSQDIISFLVNLVLSCGGNDVPQV